MKFQTGPYHVEWWVRNESIKDKYVMGLSVKTTSGAICLHVIRGFYLAVWLVQLSFGTKLGVIVDLFTGLYRMRVLNSRLPLTLAVLCFNMCQIIYSSVLRPHPCKIEYRGFLNHVPSHYDKCSETWNAKPQSERHSQHTWVLWHLTQYTLTHSRFWRPFGATC